ncbi:MAG TPA: hypothetical protein PKE64_17195 [Anaerolineae bacterium]|nr:hypothetical protein [Anaerolineae bacterium]HMR65746.1 hypothetical protein [Anaerolineae bacterium]
MNSKQLSIILLTLVTIAILAACNTASAGTTTAKAAQIPEITIKATDFSFEAPAQIEAGLVKLNLVNEGQEPHHAQLVRLNEGVTLAQFQAALQQGPEAAFPLLAFVGGPGLVDPGLSSQVTLDLVPGQYVLLCFIPSHDGVPHLAKGMVRPLEVVARTEQVEVANPQADLIVKMVDFAYVLPAEIKAGRQVWQIVNEGPQPHEIMLVKLAEGKSMADLQAFLQSPHGAPPFSQIGGFQGINAGASGWLNLDLTPGEYAAVCHIPDPASGHAHSELGMVRAFSVK